MKTWRELWQYFKAVWRTRRAKFIVCPCGNPVLPEEDMRWRGLCGDCQEAHPSHRANNDIPTIQQNQQRFMNMLGGGLHGAIFPGKLFIADPVQRRQLEQQQKLTRDRFLEEFAKKSAEEMH